MWDFIGTFFCSDGFFTSVVTHIDVLAGIVDKYMSGMSNVRIVSILLMLLAFILFLFLVIVIYVKSIIAFLKLDNSTTSQSEKKIIIQKKEDTIENNDENIEQKTSEYEQKIHDELILKELTEQQEAERKKQKQQEILKAKEKEEKKKEEQKIKQKAEQKKIAQIQDSGIELDWKKGITDELDNTLDSNMVDEILSYKQNNKSLQDLMSLIIDMIARKVDVLKIAQTISYRNQGQSSEEDILQTITEINNFLALAVQGKFKTLKNSTSLPDVKTTIYHLSQGDTTYALALMEALMDSKIETANIISNGPKKDLLFQETSYIACTFGTLSALSDVRLATSSFELAIELHPQNVNAWSRVGDMYSKAGSSNLAAKTYQHVLNIADDEINIAQVANANKMLSQYYYEQGNNLHAAKLYNESKVYYDSLGINRRLDRQELEIIELIENKQDINQTIELLLANHDLQLNYM